MATIQSPIIVLMDYWQDDHGGYPNDYDDFDICVECVCRMSVDIITHDIDYRMFANETMERLQ